MQIDEKGRCYVNGELVAIIVDVDVTEDYTSQAAERMREAGEALAAAFGVVDWAIFNDVLKTPPYEPPDQPKPGGMGDRPPRELVCPHRLGRRERGKRRKKR